MSCPAMPCHALPCPAMLAMLAMLAMPDLPLAHCLPCPLPCPGPRCLQKYVPVIEKLPPKQRFLMRRALENWRFGAGKDYRL